jgi:RNA polymerase sigma factor (sigma-70 family)
MEPTTRPSLVLRLRDPQDTAAWSEFVEIYEPLIYRLAKNKGLQDADAQDLCQDVLRAVASAIERWDPNPAKGRFRGWLFRITRNLLVNFLVDRRRQIVGSGSSSIFELLEAQPASDVEAEAEFEVEFRRRAFRWAADQVKKDFAETTWQAFWKTGVENKPIAAVAEELGLSVGAIYIARTRVLAKLRERVSSLAEDSGFDLGGDDHEAAPEIV